MTERTHLIWLHGWGQSAACWQHLTPELPHYKHHFMNYRNCTRLEHFREQLQSLLRDIGEPVYAVGWSLGGMLLLEHMIDEATRSDWLPHIKRALIVSSTLRFVNRDRELGWPSSVLRRMQAQIGREAERPENAEVWPNLDCSPTLHRFRQAMLGVEAALTWPEHTSACDFGWDGLHAGLDYLLDTDLQPQWESVRSTISARIHWLHGDRDNVCPLRGLPKSVHSVLHVCPAAGHALFLTHAEWFLEQLRSMVRFD